MQIEPPWTPSWLGNGAEVVDHVCLGHPYARVDDGECVGVLVRDDLDAQLCLALQLRGIRKRLVPCKCRLKMRFETLIHQPNDETQVRVSKTQGSPDLVQGIRRVGDQLSQEDLLVAAQKNDKSRMSLSFSTEFMIKTCFNLDDTKSS